MLSHHNNSFPIRQWMIDLLSIAVFIGMFYAIWLGSYALFTPDEGRYSEVAREMVTTGDYITPRLNGVVFLDKPILYYWLQALAINLFGIKEWALRFWPVSFGIFGSISAYIAGRLLFDRRAGMLSAIILASSPLYYGASHYANLDLEVAVLISTSLLSFIVAMKAPTNMRRNCFLISAYIFSGLAALTKGLIGLAFPALIIGAWILLLNRWSTLKKMHLVIGLLIFAAITTPWYFLVQKANPEFFQFFFIKQQVSRFLTTDYFNNTTPGWFYLPIVIAGLFPWGIFIFQAFFEYAKKLYQNRQNHFVELYLLLWVIIVFTFFSIPKSKTIGYILPIFPALALIIGSYLSQVWNQPKNKGIYFGMILFLISCLGIAIASLIIPKIPALEISATLIPYIYKIALIYSISGLIFLFLLFRKTTLPVLFCALTLSTSILLLTICSSTTSLNEKTIKPLAVELNHLLKPNDEIVTYFRYYQDLPMYLERRITIVADWQAKDIPQRDNWVRELWYGMPFQDTSTWLINENTFWQRWESDKRLFVFMNASSMDEFSKKTKVPMYQIAKYNEVVLISNKML